MAQASASAIKKVGAFQILGTLGKGAHSTILHIRRSADGRQYALKIVPILARDELKFFDQAQHEFDIGQRLSLHPNLIKVYALETRRDWLFRIKEVRLLIEYVNGRTLDTFQRIPIPQLVQVFAKVAAGMAYMHNRNICHADLKPNNILLSRTGDVKIIDYGLAWLKGENKARVQGTPEYMAPEQVKHRMVNERTDMFNFGATMYRMVAWRNIPLTAGGGMALPAKTWEEQLKPVPDCNRECPAELAKLIHHCLAHNPHNRPERMSEVQITLEKIADELIHSDDDRLEALEWQE